MSATITGYSIGVFVHICAVVVAFGVTFAFPFMGSTTGRLQPDALPTMHRTIAKIERYLIGPGLAVVLLAGIYLLADGPWEGSDSFIAVGFIAVVLLGAMQGAIFIPRNRKALALIERDLAAGGAPSEEYAAVTKQIALAGQVATLIIAVTIFFMVVKP